MSTTPEPEPAEPTGALALEPNPTGPADVPPTADLTDTADIPQTVTDPAALADRLTGSGDLSATAAAMIAAGAPAERVDAAVAHTKGYAAVVTELLAAVEAVLIDAPGSMARLTAANNTLLALEREA